MHSCHYCQTYQTVDDKLRRTQHRNGRKYHYRFCKKIGGEVQADTEPCEEFHPAKFFWCEKDENWMFIVACLNRNCRCHQKEEVLDAVRGFDLGKEFDMKPTLVIRKEEAPKPKLKLRKKIVLIPKKPKLVKKNNVVLIRRKK